MRNFKQREEEDTSKDFYADSMRISDLDEVLSIETSTFPSPWTRANFMFELNQNRCSHNFVLRCRRDARVRGFSSIWVLFDELKINNIAIEKEYRGRGLGRFLLERILEFGCIKGCDIATLEVRPSNSVAMSMYRKFGFQISGVRRGYYSDNGEDAYCMSLDVNEWMKGMRSL